MAIVEGIGRERAEMARSAGSLFRTTRRHIIRRVVSMLPWHLRMTAETAILNFAARRPPFEGVYRTFEEIPGAYPDSPQRDAVTARATLAQASVSSGRPAAPGHGLLMSAVAAMIRSASGDPLKILDFGGGPGVDFATVVSAHSVNGEKLTYLIVDMPDVCLAGSRAWKEDQRIAYSSEIPEGHRSFDIAYAWGAIHYADDPIALLRTLARCADKAVMIAGSPFSERAFVRAQVNFGPAFPQWVISEPAAVAAMRAEGFELVFRAAGEEQYNVENYPIEYSVDGSTTLLFLRR